MSQGIVDFLKPIQVKDDQADIFFMASGRIDGLFDPVLQEDPVGQFGQAVMGGLIHDPLLKGCRLGAQFTCLIYDQGTGLIGHHRAYVLAPEKKDKGHGVEHPQYRLIFLDSVNADQADAAGDGVTVDNSGNGHGKYGDNQAVNRVFVYR